MSKIAIRLRHSPALVRIVTYLLGVVMIASPIFMPLYQWEYSTTQGKSVIWAPISLFGVFVLGLPLWLRSLHHCADPWQKLGLRGTAGWWRRWLQAFGVGAGGVALLYALQLAWGWGTWMPPEGSQVIPNLCLGFLVGLGVGLAEEILFRGWLLFELEQDYGIRGALWLNASFFAISHYFRPLEDILASWPQFLGLLLLGLTLVWARRIPVPLQGLDRGTTLAYAAGLHGGLVWAYYQVDVNDLILPTGRVPAAITGLGGNPLAGVLGLALLGAIAYGTYRLSHAPKTGS